MVFCPDCGTFANALIPFIGVGAALVLVRMETKLRSLFGKDKSCKLKKEYKHKTKKR